MLDYFVDVTNPGIVRIKINLGQHLGLFQTCKGGYSSCVGLMSFVFHSFAFKVWPT